MNHSAYEQFGFTLQKSGSNWKMCCPFHKENIPSFIVYSDSSYHCFGCHAHGSYEDFIMFFSGDSNRIFYVTSLDDIQATREEREVVRVKRRLESQLIEVLKQKNFATKEFTWNFFDQLFLRVVFMRDNSAAFMETILFIKREGNTILKKVKNERRKVTVGS